MRKITLFALVSVFFACSPVDVPQNSGSVSNTNTVTSTKTGTGTAASNTSTATATNTKTVATADAGVRETVTETVTVTVTEVDTSTKIDVSKDAGVVTVDATPGKNDASSVKTADAPVVADTQVQSSACGTVEICGNGVDDDCNGLIDDLLVCGANVPKADAGTVSGADASACTGTESIICTELVGSVLYTGKKVCTNGKFGSCQNLVAPASPDAGTDKVQPVVSTPRCGLSDTSNLPAGVPIPFYVDATDDVGVTSCSFFVNSTLAPGTSVLEASGSWRLNIVLSVGNATINVRCLDASGNGGVPTTLLTVKAVGSDGGVSTDTLPSADALPAIDTLVPSDTQVAADTIASIDTQVRADAIQSPTTCFVLVNNQYMSIPIGQQIVCAYGTLAGTQQCGADGKMTPCAATGNTVSELKAVVNCSLTKVTLSGNVAGNLFLSPTDTSPLKEICLVGDGINGMTPGNRTHCLPYDPDSNHAYEFGKQLAGSQDVINLVKGSVYRITYVGVTQQTAITGEVRWAFNNTDPTTGTAGTNGLPVMANDPANLCWVTSETILGDTGKLIVDGRKVP